MQKQNKTRQPDLPQVAKFKKLRGDHLRLKDPNFIAFMKHLMVIGKVRPGAQVSHLIFDASNMLSPKLDLIQGQEETNLSQTVLQELIPGGARVEHLHRDHVGT